MKNVLLLSVFALFALTRCAAQSADAVDETAIEKVIVAFAKAGDQNDADALDGYLDANYRVVMNRLFGSDEVSAMSRALYLEKIRTKEFGGDDRKLTIEHILINGTVASAHVTFAGSAMTFRSIIVLVKDTQGQWKLVSETPVVM